MAVGVDAPRRVFAVRHGETEWSLSGHHTGTADLPPVALFAHGHVLRVLAARWLGLPPGDGRLFLLDTGTLSVLSHGGAEPTLKTRNAPVFAGTEVAGGALETAPPGAPLVEPRPEHGTLPPR